MELFNRSLDELIPHLSTKKFHLLRFLKRNFKQNIHYIETACKKDNSEKRGGHNRIDVVLTEEAFELLKNSYNLRNKTFTELSNNTVLNVIMPIESQTIGFIENTYKNIVETIRQQQFGKYRVDMYFPKYKIIIECDEFNHADIDIALEKEREQYLVSFGNTIIRYNPNEPNFNLSSVLQKINSIIIIGQLPA